MLSFCTSTGILPAACTPSEAKIIPCSLAIFPISCIGFTAPISLLAYMIAIRIVVGRIALRTSSGSTRPSLPTGRYVTSNPCFSRFLQVSSTALCSIAWVMMWLPFSRYISATPLIIRLSDSVAPLVKMISFAVAPISEATCWRAFSTASSPAQPNEWLRLAAFPNFSVKYGSIASSTRGSIGVVA